MQKRRALEADARRLGTFVAVCHRLDALACRLSEHLGRPGCAQQAAGLTRTGRSSGAVPPPAAWSRSSPPYALGNQKCLADARSCSAEHVTDVWGHFCQGCAW